MYLSNTSKKGRKSNTAKKKPLYSNTSSIGNKGNISSTLRWRENKLKSN